MCASTLGTVLGGITASMTLMLLSALGLGAVIAASDTLFHAIKWAGAAYLVYLGISTWRSRPQGRPHAPPAAQSAEVAVPATSLPSATWGQLYRKGFMVGIGNPKDLLFFSALFPQFMNPGRAGGRAAGHPGGDLDGAGWQHHVRLCRLASQGGGPHGPRRPGPLVQPRDGRGAFIAAGGLLAAIQPLSLRTGSSRSMRGLPQ